LPGYIAGREPSGCGKRFKLFHTGSFGGCLLGFQGRVMVIGTGERSYFAFVSMTFGEGISFVMATMARKRKSYNTDTHLLRLFL
jgi:hypothetical protein